MVQIAPSILTADFGHLKDELDLIRKDANQIHVDIMDGHFVPNMSMGTGMVKSLRRITDLPLDVHLMIEDPERMIPAFAEAGADTITVHAEACPQLHHTLSMIKGYGLRCGVALNPGTSLGTLDAVLEMVDLVLLMTVNPGFGGQKFIPASVARVETMRRMLDERNPKADLEVDGGINASTCETIVRAGANLLVMGSCVFDGKDPAGNIAKLRAMVDAI